MSNEAPPCKKIRIDPDISTDPTIAIDENHQNITKLSDDLLIFIFSFLSYPQSIISLSKSCTLFKQLIDNHSALCIKHFNFTSTEHNIASNKLLKQISNLLINTNNNNTNIHTFFNKLNNLVSLELLSIDEAMVPIDTTVLYCYINSFLKPLQNKLINLTVNTWEDAALTRNSFNFNNMIFNNVRSVFINGKDTKYPFNITEYTPNVEKITLTGVNVLLYSLFRMIFDMKSSLKHLSQFYIYGGSMSHNFGFYDSKYNAFVRTNKVKTYNLSELDIDPTGGSLQLFHYMISHSMFAGDKELNFVRLILFYNQFTLRSLRINYDVFYNDISLEGVEQINGLKEFVDKTNSKQINLPKLQDLTLTMTRLAANDYCRIYHDLLFYKVIAPSLRSVELIPGVCCWHDYDGIIPFLSVLLGDQLYALDIIKIHYPYGCIGGLQREYLEWSIQKICEVYKEKKRKVNIILQIQSHTQQWNA